MRFEDQAFLLWFLPLTLSAYFLATVLASRIKRPRLPDLVLLVASLIYLTYLPSARGHALLLAAAVVACLTVSFVIDLRRGIATVSDPLTAAVYLVQLPLLAGGPLVRFRDFQAQIAKRHLTMGAFTYGVRRLVIGYIKVVFIAAVLARPTDRIFGLHPTRLTADAAWLAALCFSLQLYFQFSGYADMAIGLGRMIGLRYPENFRRPYTADSIREFWRCWNITLIAWLRDYVRFPIAGRDATTPRFALTMLAGFCAIGLWHRPGWMALAWAVYATLWLGLETLGLGGAIARLPRVLRHAYVLLVMIVGWVILRAPTPAVALTFFQTMSGWRGLPAYTALTYMTPNFWMALVAGMIFAGPLVPWISRWRVSLDAAAVSVLLMAAATGVFLWRGGIGLVNSLGFAKARR